MKSEMTTVQLEKSLVRSLGKLKKYDRQTYNEIIRDLVDFANSEKMNDAYVEFIGKSQQMRMRELWDNRSDEVWGNV